MVHIGQACKTDARAQAYDAAERRPMMRHTTTLPFTLDARNLWQAHACHSTWEQPRCRPGYRPPAACSTRLARAAALHFLGCPG
jgi:hypothetical protein